MWGVSFVAVLMFCLVNFLIYFSAFETDCIELFGNQKMVSCKSFLLLSKMFSPYTYTF